MPLSIADYTVPAVSVQYIQVPVSAAVAFSTDVVALAFTAVGAAPVSGDWVTGDWVVGTPMIARVLIGPGTSKPLVKGLYDVYVRVTDNPESPVIYSGLLEVTP